MRNQLWESSFQFAHALPCLQRHPGLYEDEAACARETGLLARLLAPQHVQNFRRQYFVTECYRQANQCLFDGADSSHEDDPLALKLVELLLRRADHLLSVANGR
jgi:hypothetical protein